MVGDVLLGSMWDDRINQRPSHQERVATAAYYRWIDEGRPDGCALRHWGEAWSDRVAELAFMIYQRYPSSTATTCWLEAERFLTR
jgi:hypothetical protein